jgi:DNA polymerase I-like protein with 3'-5' exonuclease and polymerase domains
MGTQPKGADLIKSVMIELYEILSSGGHEEIRMIGSIHDELLLEGPETIANEMAQILMDVMKKVGNKILDPVPVDAEVTISASWGGD